VNRVLFVTSELYPVVKTGGLADVSASLPDALCKAGADMRILLPGYPAAMELVRRSGVTCLAEVKVSDDSGNVRLWQTQLPGTTVTLLIADCPALFDRPGGPYQDESGQDWWDNAHRYLTFARVAAMISTGRLNLDWIPDLVHCNDWQTGLVPVLLQSCEQPPATVFTVHNLAYQGLFSQDTFRTLGLPDSLWQPDQLEFYGQLSFIKGGLVFSDHLTTVSEGYAREILRPEYGYGLDGLLRHRQADLTGILNGIDTDVWNPECDAFLTHHYSPKNLKGKAFCRRSLLQTLGLERDVRRPLLGFVGRLVEQKGVGLLLQVIPQLLERGCQVVILGAGMPAYEESLHQLSMEWPYRFSFTSGYDEGLAHRITAGADLFLMPSLFEPCGLNQMYSLRYGTVPVVHRTGGLADTVHDPLTAAPNRANGFCFTEPEAPALMKTLDRALSCFSQRYFWRKLQANGMAGDYSWSNRARSYEEIYQSILQPGAGHARAP